MDDDNQSEENRELLSSLPVDEVHLPHDVVHLQPGDWFRDEVLAPEGHLRVFVAPVSEAADYPSWGWYNNDGISLHTTTTRLQEGSHV